MPPATDRPFGSPRASARTECYVTIAVALGGVGLATLCGAVSGVSWSAWQWAIVIIVAFDLAGGIASMSLPAVRKKFHVTAHPVRPMAFTAFHIHPFVFAMAIPEQGWPSMIALYASAFAGVILMAKVRRAFLASIALSWCAGAITLASALGVAPGLEWLAPAYLLKLVGSYSVSAGRAR